MTPSRCAHKEGLQQADFAGGQQAAEAEGHEDDQASDADGVAAVDGVQHPAHHRFFVVEALLQLVPEGACPLPVCHLVHPAHHPSRLSKRQPSIAAPSRGKRTLVCLVCKGIVAIITSYWCEA